MEMCHYKTSADRLHVIIVTIEIAILYSLASCLIRFPFLHNAFRSLHGVLYALPIVHDTSSKNARRPLQRHFRDVTLTPAKITDITLSRMTHAGSHFVPRIRHPLPTKVKKGRKGLTFSGHTYPTVSSKRRGRCVEVWFRLVQKC